MADIHWTSYVGMASGVTGVIIALISLYKTSKIKSLDLRLELKRTALDINSLHEELKTTLERALKSRQRTSAALGKFKSGGMQQWAEEHATDSKAWETLGEKIPDKESSYNSLSKEKLEKKLVGAHELKIKLESLKEKYTLSMVKDEGDSNFLREQAHRNVHQNT